MSVTVYVPNDSTAQAAGANDIAEAISKEAALRDVDITLVRNGSRGLCWLEPLVEVATNAGRIAYGQVELQDIDSLFDSGFLEGQPHDLCLGLIEELPYLKKQSRLTFARAGLFDPLDFKKYQSLGGTDGIRNCLNLCSQDIVNEVKDSSLRGRGGAAFPAGIKMQTVLDAKTNGYKYIVCNADEGDSGTFADRLLIEADPFTLIEGMCIAGLATGASRGFIYLRSEYPFAAQQMQKALAVARQNGLLGSAIFDTEFNFDITLRIGAGSYICGEETALLESLEGKRGMVRAKPPLPALEGLFGQPTLVNNVITLATLPVIMAKGAETYAALGCGRSRGTMVMQLAGNIRRGGLVECEFGTSLHSLLEDFGGGCEFGDMHAVQVGGPLGAYLPESQWQTPIDYEAFSAQDTVLGHGGVVVFSSQADMAEQARFAMEFCSLESCGKCTPCRVGSQRGVEVIDRIIATSDQQLKENQLQLLNDLCDTMVDGSLCAMGSMTPIPVRSILTHFPDALTASGHVYSTTSGATS